MLLVRVVGGVPAIALNSGWLGTVTVVLAALPFLSIKVADHWEKAVVLRLGNFSGLKGPGVFLVVPVLDSIRYWIDTCVFTTSFRAEKTLTEDTVAVDVDAVLFWKVVDAKRAALEVADYREAVSWAPQTALRDVIGKRELADMLAGRDAIDERLKELIHHRTEPWGVDVLSVEIGTF